MSDYILWIIEIIYFCHHTDQLSTVEVLIWDVSFHQWCATVPKKQGSQICSKLLYCMHLSNIVNNTFITFKNIDSLKQIFCKTPTFSKVIVISLYKWCT